MVIVFEFKDFFVLDIDWGNDIFEFVFQQVVYYGKVDRCGFIRGVDNGNRVGLKQFFELFVYDQNFQ